MITKFRESFRGYNRDDVNAYIEQMNLRFSKREAELLHELNKLASSQSGEEDSPAADNITTENAALKDEIARLTSKIDTLEMQLSDASSKKDEITGERLGNILLMANDNAEKILSDAKAEAQRILAEANLKASSVEIEAAREKKRIVGEYCNKLDKLSEEYLNQCTDAIALSTVKLKDAATSISEKAKYLSENN